MPEFKPEQIENYLNAKFRAFTAIESDMATLLARSVHEVRSINRDVKSAAEGMLFELKQAKPSVKDLSSTSHTIRSLSEILTACTDFLDYFANPMIALAPEQVKPYEKFLQTIQCLKERAKQKKVNISTNGEVFGSVSGCHVFEAIPFLVIENAIKYSPDKYTVLVDFSETSSSIDISVQNVGPALTEEELPDVFEMGMRGQNAVQSGRPGFGLGLFLLKELIEVHHKGKISLAQHGAAMKFGAVPYRVTSLNLSFPRAK